MEKINIIGVPEHFNFPWRQLVQDQPFLEQEVELVWDNEARGSGAMNRAIRDGEAEIGVILTESFVKDKIEGNTGKIIGFHVSSPLIWGVHVPAGSKIQAEEDLKNVPFLVSRMGSGSHLMAYLLAKHHGWSTADMDFEIIGNLEGAIQAFKKQTPKAFLWEKFTTKPLVDKGWFRRVGEVPTPWPCFVIVASGKAIAEYPKLLLDIRDALYRKNERCMTKSKDVILAISQQYQLDEADVVEWIGQTSWATSGMIDPSLLNQTMETLLDLGLIKQRLGVESLVAEEFIIWK